MGRRIPAYLATFLVAAGLTWTGLARAKETGPDVVLEAVPKIVVSPLAEASSARELSGWSETIERRLASLPRATRIEGRDHQLDASVDALAASLSGRAAIEVRELETGRVLAETHHSRLLNPASNQKLVTAIAAVELLGPDYVFETTVWRAGDTLILRGEGDPDLHVADLHDLAATTLAKLGRESRVTRVLVDDTAFDSRSLGPGYHANGPGESYEAPSGALAIDFGTVEIVVAADQGSGAPTVHTSAGGDAVSIQNQARIGPGHVRVSTAEEDGRTVITISGRAPTGPNPARIRRRVGDPGLFAGATFADLVSRRVGGETPSVTRGSVPADAVLVAVHRSKPLISVLSSALRYSNNFTAEQVLRTLAWRAYARPGSWDDGAALLERFAQRVSPDGGDQRFANGSGLTLEGRLSPAFVGDVLGLAGRPGSATALLLASFARSGGEGTLRGRIPGAGARVRAKTGTYAGASSLSGVVRGQKDGRPLSFSFLVNGGDLQENRAAQDRLAAKLLRL